MLAVLVLLALCCALQDAGATSTGGISRVRELSLRRGGVLAGLWSNVSGSRSLTMRMAPPPRTRRVAGNNGARRNPLQVAIKPSVTNALIAINILAYLATLLRPELQTMFMKINSRVAYGETYRLITGTFLHGSPQHLFFNLYSLYQVGPLVERAFGAERFGMSYVAAGALANTMTFLMGKSPYSVGASGSIFGMIGALAVHFYRNKNILGVRAEAGLESIKRTVAMNLLYGFSMSGIDNTAHLFGLLSGSLVSYLFGPRLFVVSGSRLRIIDRPLINYGPMWRGLAAQWFGGGDAGGNQEGAPKSFKPRGAPLRE
jgi:rhomboid protease GluP